MSITTACFAAMLLLLAPNAPAGGDRAKLQGTWSGTTGPQKVEIRIEVAGDKLSLSLIPANDPTKIDVIKGDYKIDETKTPKTWDFLNGKASGGRSISDGLAIYKLDGDTLTLCNAAPGQPRPTEFTEGEATATRTIVFKRVKPAAPAGAK